MKIKFSRYEAQKSDWVCYLFGSYGSINTLKYYPSKGNVPNFFVRFMTRIFFGCRWEKLKDNSN